MRQCDACLRACDFLRGAESVSGFAADFAADFDDGFDDDFAEDLEDDLEDFLPADLEPLFSSSGAAFTLCPRRELLWPPVFALVLDEDESLLSEAACEAARFLLCVSEAAAGSEMRRWRPAEIFVPEM